MYRQCGLHHTARAAEVKYVIFLLQRFAIMSVLSRVTLCHPHLHCVPVVDVAFFLQAHAMMSSFEQASLQMPDQYGRTGGPSTLYSAMICACFLLFASVASY